MCTENKSNILNQHAEIIWKNQQDIQKAVAKEEVLNTLRLDQQYKKSQLAEMRRQAHKAEHTKLELSQDGELILQTCTSLVQVPKREIANFRIIEAMDVRSVKGERGITCVLIEVNGQREAVYLDHEKIGKAGYLQKKITQIGGRFYVDKKSVKENLLEMLWTEIRRLSLRFGEDYLEIPEMHGWNINCKDEILFVKEGKVIWADVQKMAN